MSYNRGILPGTRRELRSIKSDMSKTTLSCSDSSGGPDEIRAIKGNDSQPRDVCIVAPMSGGKKVVRLFLPPIALKNDVRTCAFISSGRSQEGWALSPLLSLFSPHRSYSAKRIGPMMAEKYRLAGCETRAGAWNANMAISKAYSK